MSLEVGLAGLVRPFLMLVVLVLAGRGLRPEPWDRSLAEAVVLDLVIGCMAVAMSVYLLSAAGVPALPITVTLASIMAVRGLLRSSPGPVDRWLAGIAVLALLTRVGPVLDWHASLFLDPAVEAALAARLLDLGHLPADWGMLAPIAVNHQPGFASVVAFIAGLPRLLPRTIVLFSAGVQAAVPVAVYMVARSMSDRRTSIAAGALALASVFPAYTVVAGMNSANLAFLMALVTVAVWIEHRPPAWYRLLMLAGVAIVHPLGAIVVGICVGTRAVIAREWRSLFWNGAVGLGAAALVLPYYDAAIAAADAGAELVWRSQARLINPGLILPIGSVVEPLYTFFYNPSGIWYQYLSAFPLWKLVLARPVGNLLLVVAGAAVLIGLDQRRQDSRVAWTWLAVFWMLSWGQSAFQVQFPAWKFIYPTRMKFFMVLPLSIVLATAVRYRGYVLRLWDRRIPVAVAIIAVVVPVSLVSMLQFHARLDGEQVVADGDLAAMRWIDDHTRPDALILNELEAREAGTFIGDAGQWIPVYTGRDVVYPPLSITGNVSELQVRTELYRALGQRDTERFRDLVDRYGVDYVMLSRGSMVLYSRLDRISRQDMVATCGCRPVFSNDRAAIYEVS